jgi:hypothetical protein
VESGTNFGIKFQTAVRSLIGLCGDGMAGRVPCLYMRARGELNRAVIMAAEAQ